MLKKIYDLPIGYKILAFLILFSGCIYAYTRGQTLKQQRQSFDCAAYNVTCRIIAERGHGKAW